LRGKRSSGIDVGVVVDVVCLLLWVLRLLSSWWWAWSWGWGEKEEEEEEEEKEGWREEEMLKRVLMAMTALSPLLFLLWAAAVLPGCKAFSSWGEEQQQQQQEKAWKQQLHQQEEGKQDLRQYHHYQA